MVKIRNIYGDEYRGKQRNAVYQRKYGRQIRRIKEDKKANRAPAQVEQQRRFKVGLAWYKSLSYLEKEGLKLFLDQRGITLTPQQYAIKTALSRGKVTKEVFEEQVITWVYKEGWPLEGWLYRQEITLTNNTASDLTDYQVKLELDASKVGPHFDWANQGNDLRFYDEAGNKLSYYVEAWDAENKTATVWVKVGLIPANGATTLRMYYGNDQAISESDANAVFDLFDDFEDNDISDWIILNGGFSASNGIVSTTGERNLMHKGIIAEKGIIIETSARAGSGGMPGCAFAIQDVDNYCMARINEPVDKLELVIKDAGTYETVAEVQKTINAGVWYAIKTIWKSDGTVRMEVYGGTSERIGFDYENLNLIGTLDYTTATKWSSGYVGLRCYRAGSYDWVRVRKYAEQEPAVEFGAEEYGLVEAPTTIQVEHIVIEHPGIQNIYIIDDEGNLLKEYTGLSNVANGEIATTIYWKNDTEKTVRTVIIESISGVLNKVVL